MSMKKPSSERLLESSWSSYLCVNVAVLLDPFLSCIVRTDVDPVINNELTCEVMVQDSVWGGCWRWAVPAPCGSSATGSSAPAAAHYSSGPAASSWRFTVGELKNQTMKTQLSEPDWKKLYSRNVSQNACSCVDCVYKARNIVGWGDFFRSNQLPNHSPPPLALLT